MQKILGKTLLPQKRHTVVPIIHPGVAFNDTRHQIKQNRFTFDVKTGWLEQAFTTEHTLQMFALNHDLDVEHLDAFKEELDKIAIATNHTNSALLNSLEHLTQSGVSLEQGMDSLTAIGRVATATGSSLEGISHVTAALLKNFDINPENLEAVFDTLVGTSKDSGLPFKTLIKQLPALSQSMQDLGITGSDGLSSLMGHLHLAMQHSQTPETAPLNLQKLLHTLTQNRLSVPHIDIIRTAKKSGFDSLQTLLSHLNTETESPLLEKEDGHEFLQEMIVSLEKFSQVKAQSQKYKGLIDTRFNAMMKTAIAQTIQLDIATRQLGLTFADVFGPSLTPVIQNMTSVMHACKRMMTDYPKLTQVIGTLTLGFGAFASILSVATAMQWIWNAASMANPIGFVIAGIGASVVMLVANLNKITSTFNTLKEQLNGFKNSLKRTITIPPRETDTLNQTLKSAHKTVFYMNRPLSPISISAPISVHIPPGMNETQVAEQIERQLREREEQARAKQRGVLFDYSEHAIP